MFLNLSTFWLTCFLFQYWPSALAKYRHFHVDNTDICNTGINLGPKLGLGETKTLNIGTGAAIFQLKSPSTSFQPEYR